MRALFGADEALHVWQEAVSLAEDLQLWLQCCNRNIERTDGSSTNFCAEIQPEGNATVLQSRQNAATPRCVPQPTFTPVFIYIARPSCRPLIGFA